MFRCDFRLAIDLCFSPDVVMSRGIVIVSRINFDHECPVAEIERAMAAYVLSLIDFNA